MLFNNSNTNYPIVINKVIPAGYDFDIALLDWFAMCKETREAIIAYAGYNEDVECLASQECSVAIIVPRRQFVLDLNNVYLHISTIGRIDPNDINSYIIKCLNGNIETLENPVTLSAMEKIEILCSQIQSKDMRGVI
jgi:hypothetical protein